MKTNSIAIHQNNFRAMSRLLTSNYSSPNTIRAYEAALGSFFEWYELNGVTGLNKAVVNEYRRHLVALVKDGALGESTVNLRLTVLRLFAVELRDNGLLDPQLAAGIGNVKSVAKSGKHMGTWLSLESARHLLSLPPDNIKGYRDHALLSVLLLSGVRRDECAQLRVNDLRKLGNRWVLANISGKGNKERTIGVSETIVAAINKWHKTADITDGYIFRSINKSGVVSKDNLSSDGIYFIVKQYSLLLGISISPHDLRRSFAQLAKEGGATIFEIKEQLGHANFATTEMYLANVEDFTQTAADAISI
ncbi:MAG: tyrosine-type recombinase/integrase [Euryarchaeota archaeon]|nr:tyrosine-type recombinase/integrase [Euryarchaeota archaeon]